MNNVYFKYKKHPGDFYRNTSVVALPNPQEDLESFLVQFLKHYQSDERVTYVDDLYKLLHNDFFSKKDKHEFIQIIGPKTRQEVKNEIQNIEVELRSEAFENFYNLVQTKQIEIITNGKEQ